ncbi:hypothetical protein KFL_002930070 [Klebsormidium nitens]|uniref:Uncharacterized protein n=1 Tax=Klebsormidium nitens TaxID=105231 RepID=A0A1Y1I6D3_KLENI|nr:hypothetical protein KFL_002930070 [Klebsormidium nitens]|eukprot:GAQ86510.1 hypothetical protein KFL_002930070 [Klebsormidium nitens]
MRARGRANVNDVQTRWGRANAGGVFRRHMCRASVGEAGAELSELEKVQKLDKLIDKLREASDRELPQIVAQNVMELDQVFWLRMATRSDVCKSEDDKEDYVELSQRVMSLVDKIVRKTTEKIDDNAGVLEMVLDAAAEQTGEWRVPLSKERINAMRKVMDQRQEYLDETFLASVFAYTRKVEKENMGSMLAVLQRVMQLWASWYLTKHPKGRLNKDKKTPEEAVLERVLKAEVEDWEPILRENLVFPQSKLNEEKFFNTIQSRMERSILYMENGSYSQRVVAEYLREIQTRSQNILEASRAPPPEVRINFEKSEQSGSQ